MKTATARDANQNFSKLLAEVEKGATIAITKNGRTVAIMAPMHDDVTADPVWRKKFERMRAAMAEWPRTGYRVGSITQDDKYGDIST